ncbi:hypothetical protein I7I53_12252 [Histoplasma capsulatum var. duboisii H88]|uniref:Uncharacterized protein n=1 Tax=Ajellomyces capsulatus (strain H88) TaxID=544711 RepID=A0A8A1LUW9_AJEC8|nr:hypothetical protein I7I53_12252 [Histoplasma capsulatum var. duboisii H88]
MSSRSLTELQYAHVFQHYHPLCGPRASIFIELRDSRNSTIQQMTNTPPSTLTADSRDVRSGQPPISTPQTK